MFICPNCKGIISEHDLNCIHCGKQIEWDGIKIFTEKGNLELMSEDKYYGFDTIASNYDTSRNRIEESKEGTLIGEYLGHGKALLDLGAGTGYYSIPIAKTGCKVIAADISLNMLRILKSKMELNNLNNISLCKMNAYELNIDNHTVEAVLINQVFQHVENPEKVIHEIKRVLKPNGKFLNIYYKGEVLSSEEEKLVFNEVSSKISELYDHEIKNSGQVLLKKFGWISQQEQQINIFNHFNLIEFIENSAFTKYQTLSINDYLEQYKKQVNTSQALIDKTINESIINNIKNQIIDIYGERVLKVKLETKETTSIQVFNVL